MASVKLMKSIHYHLDYAMLSGCSGQIEFSIWMAKFAKCCGGLTDPCEAKSIYSL
jgi:hypothetical protein